MIGICLYDILLLFLCVLIVFYGIFLIVLMLVHCFYGILNYQSVLCENNL